MLQEFGGESLHKIGQKVLGLHKNVCGRVVR